MDFEIMYSFNTAVEVTIIIEDIGNRKLTKRCICLMKKKKKSFWFVCSKNVRHTRQYCWTPT